MNIDDNKDIVEEIFNRSAKTDTRDSALFAGADQPACPAGHEQGRMDPVVNTEPVEVEDSAPRPAADAIFNSEPAPPPQDADSPAKAPAPESKDAAPPAEHQPRPAKYASPKTPSTAINKILTYRTGVIATAAVVFFALTFFVGSFLLQDGAASTQTTPAPQPSPTAESETAPDADPAATADSKPALETADTELVVNTEPVEVSKPVANTPAFDKQPPIHWGRLLNEISSKMPSSIQLEAIKSTDPSRMSLQGAALSSQVADVFVDSLNTNTQIVSASLANTVTDLRHTSGLIPFSIGCSLLPVKSKHIDPASAPDENPLFSTAAAQQFFDSIRPAAEGAGCKVKALLVSPAEIFLEEEDKTTINRRQAAFILLGTYKDILPAIEQLQTRTRSVWFDSVSIKHDRTSGQLQAAMNISIYIADNGS